MSKKIFTILLVGFLFILASCTTSPTTETITDETPDTVIPSETVVETPEPTEYIEEISSITGLEDTTITQYDYFNPLKGVKITNEKDENITHLLSVTGDVHYGIPGDYNITYQLSYGNDEINQERTVSVIPGVINRSVVTRNTITGTVIGAQAGSIRVGTDSSIDHPVNPTFMQSELLSTAVPSNKWWTSLLVHNYGKGDGIYTNPLRSAFSNQGAEITNPGAGFVQYWNPDGFNTMANFSLALPDLFLKTSNLNASYQTHVIDYSDTSIHVAMRNVSDPKDLMVLTYQQGSPYVFAEVANSNTPYFSFGTNGVAGFEFFTVNGTKLTTNSHQGNGIVVRFIQKHIGYQTSRPAQVGQPIYGDRYFLITTPDQTSFQMTSSGLSMDLKDKNYFSVSAINALADAPFFHQHGLIKTLTGDVSFTVNHETSIVETTYQVATQNLNSGSYFEPLQYLLPHHYQNSEVTLTDYEFETVRGFLKLMTGSSFKTQLSFHGLVPSMTLPINDEFSELEMASYLADLNLRTETNDLSNFLNDEGPYWNGKALYPLSQGLIYADQINDQALKQSFITKLRYLLTDWFTYSGAEDSKYLYYNERWGSVYYSNNDFNTATELSDHAFTHGYLVYASSILAMYDETFVDDYSEMVYYLLNDYLYPNKDDYQKEYLRSFDPWAGHTWAHGFGTFAEGNNIESSSEAIQSWVGGYLWALQTGDEKLRDAAIYGFVHELSSAKTYMFDYSDTVFKDNYKEFASVAGMIWGGKYDYATWFGANPTFIYGIQWLPNGEYISNYALDSFERARLQEIYTDYLKAKNQVIDTWFANMWSIQALLNPDTAIQMFDANKILNDDYPSDLSQTYHLLHGLKSYGNRTTSYIMEISPYLSSSIYENQAGEVYALIWNPSNSAQNAIFTTPNGTKITIATQANSFEAYKLS
jgi:endo-1,3(4)-beta-glucanase